MCIQQGEDAAFFKDKGVFLLQTLIVVDFTVILQVFVPLWVLCNKPDVTINILLYTNAIPVYLLSFVVIQLLLLSEHLML